MNKAAAKVLLSAYRPEDQDADDPIFAEALNEVERDAELAAWFEAGQRFDARAIAAVGQMPVPADLKELILLNNHAQRTVSVPDETRWMWKRPAAAWLAAAGFVMAFFLGRQTLPRAAILPDSGKVEGGARQLALQAVAYTEKMPALQFVCFDAAAVANWISEKSTAMQMGELLDRSVPNMQMIGSSATRWEGKPVIMIALQNGDRMAMLYIVNATDFPRGAAGLGEIIEHDGWAAKTGRSGRHFYVLTAKGTRYDVRFPMPL